MHIVLGSQDEAHSSISVGFVGIIKDFTQDWPDVAIEISGDRFVAMVVKSARCQAKHLAESANRIKML